VRQITRIAGSRVLTGDDGEELSIRVTGGYGVKGRVSIETNQIDDTTLQAAVTRAEGLARAFVGAPHSLLSIPNGAQQYLPVDLWRDASVAALQERPAAVAAMIDVVRSAGLVAAGFVGVMARCAAVMNKDGLESYYRETDCECTMLARAEDGTSSGWHGQANRDWAKIDPHLVAATAVDIAQRGANPKAVEPGRRVAILTPIAVVQLVHLMTEAFDASATDNGGTPFSKHPTGNKLGLRVFDRRLTMSSDPADPEGGYRPDFYYGMPEPRMTWVENGILTNLAYPPWYAMVTGKPYAGVPWSFRMSGGPTSIEDMVKACPEGILVNRVSNLELSNDSNGMVTGVTRDGCFLVKQGKIDQPVKNFRFSDSPWFFLNNILALGVPVRAAFGYTPPAAAEDFGDETAWPRRPLIVPPMMVQDFNFTSLAEAV
jgi:predicted Zn-dependent protease